MSENVISNFFNTFSYKWPYITNKKIYTLFQCHHFCHGKRKCIVKDKSHELLQKNSLGGRSK